MSETRIYTQYDPMERANRYNGKIVRSAGEAMSLVNNTLAVYAGVRRNQQNIYSLYHGDTNKEEMTFLSLEPGRTRTIIAIPAEGMISGGLPLTAYVYCATDSETKPISLTLSCGTGYGITRSIEDTTWNWHSVTCYPEPSPTGWSREERIILLELVNEDEVDSENITIRSISIFEEPDPNAPAWLDWTGATNMVGVVDQPLSSAMMAVLKNNLDFIARTRLARANVFNRCMASNYRTTEAAYEANEDGLGRYVIRTKPEITTLEIMVQVDVEGTDDPDPNEPQATFKVGVYDMDGNVVDSDETVIEGPHLHCGEWYQATLDISGRTAGDDTLEVRIDSKETNGEVTDQWLWNIAVLEWGPDSDNDYELPNRKYTQPDDDVRAVDILNCKNTLTHLYNTGVQILLNDLRVEDTSQHTARTADSYLSAFGMFRYLNTYLNNDYCARGVLYPSTGAKNLVFDIYLQRPNPEQVNLALEFTNPSAGFETWFTTAGTEISGGTSGARGFLIDIDGSGNIIYLEQCSGTFLDGEQITRSDTADTADVVGTGYHPENSDVDLELYVEIAYGSPFSPRSEGFQVFNWDTQNVGRRHGPIRARMKLEVPTAVCDDLNFWTANYAANGTPLRSGLATYSRDVPIVFSVMAYCTNRQWNRPFVRCVRVFEEVPSVL